MERFNLVCNIVCTAVTQYDIMICTNWLHNITQRQWRHSFPSSLTTNKVELVMTVRPIVRIHETSCYMEHGTTFFFYEFCMKIECLKDITITALCDID